MRKKPGFHGHMPLRMNIHNAECLGKLKLDLALKFSQVAPNPWDLLLLRKPQTCSFEAGFGRRTMDHSCARTLVSRFCARA